MHKDDLIAFEKEVAEAFERQEIPGPIHLSGGNEDELIEIFKHIKREDWVFSTYRSHYHALLHGIPRDWLMAEIRAGRSMNIHSESHRFHSSAIVGGCLPIAVGVAAGLKRLNQPEQVWCFVGDMAAHSGSFAEAQEYASAHELPLTFIVEDNGLSCDTPTLEVCGTGYKANIEWYRYTRQWPHSGIGRYVF
jgi:pyruvate dehydrogenase E1 component alpha subunit